jgi:hypothetical protein
MSLSKIATHRISDTALLEACARSGQVDSRQIHAHQVAGELRLTESDVGYESSLPISYYGPEPREPLDPQAVVIVCAFVLVWAVIGALMYSDDLVQMWPRMVAALSI